MDMGRKGVILVRAGETVHSVALSTRDVHLLDGQYFFRDDCSYRTLFGLNFLSGLKPPPLDTPLLSYNKYVFTIQMRQLLEELDTQRDLISFDYSYAFGDEKGSRHGARQSGFRVEGGFGSISVRPAGYCDLTVMDVGPNGTGRVHTIVDMRVKRQYPTLDRGVLRIYTRKADVGWFGELDKLILFLEQQSAKTVEILHSTV
jgi:hypothetical protein